MSIKPLNCLINLDLLLDYNSLLFSLLRSHFLISNILIPPQSKLSVELKNPSKAFDDICSLLGHLPTISFKNTFLKNFQYYLASIKPQIFAVSFLNFLKKNTDLIYITTYLDPEDVDIIMKTHKTWLDLPWIPYQETEDFIQKQKNSENNLIYFDGNREIIEKFSIKYPDLLYVLIKNSNFKCKNSFEDIKNPYIKAFLGFEEIEPKILSTSFSENLEKYPKEFMLDFTNKPLSIEQNYWDNILYLPSPLIVESYIIRGFGRGGKQLGMPTANLEITSEINELLKPIIPGIYFGWAKFHKEKGEKLDDMLYEKTYKCVISTGFNPFYENKAKTFEVYVMDKFEKDYYGAFIKVEVIGFIRCESDLKYFDHLIKMIHNDVQIADKILKNKL